MAVSVELLAFIALSLNKYRCMFTYNRDESGFDIAGKVEVGSDNVKRDMEAPFDLVHFTIHSITDIMSSMIPQTGPVSSQLASKSRTDIRPSRSILNALLMRS